jgi:3-hydroxyacyl-[acyl-carrier-protein] dehydratase
MNATSLTTTEIMAILPHRYPMIMVDRVDELVAGERITARKNVTVNEAVFQGHFPGNPTFPGVLQLEALAQAGAVALLSLPEFAGKTVYLGGIKRAKFRKMVRPGDTLILNVTIGKLAGNVGSGSGTVVVDGETACSAELLFAIS